MYANFTELTLNFKIAYVGAEGAGKKTNLMGLLELAKKTAGIPLHVEEAEGEPLYMASVPFSSEALPVTHRHFKAWAVLYGADASRLQALATSLDACDAIVFIANSDRSALRATLEAFAKLASVLQLLHKTFADAPLVVQYNHRDVASAVQPNILRDGLIDAATRASPQCWSDAGLKGFFGKKRIEFAEVEAIAHQGDGVWATLDRAMEVALAAPPVRKYLASLVESSE